MRIHAGPPLDSGQRLAPLGGARVRLTLPRAINKKSAAVGNRGRT
jgi:hypothetical protein